MEKIKDFIEDVALMMSENHFMSFEDAMDFITNNYNLKYWMVKYEQIKNRYPKHITLIACNDDDEKDDLLYKIHKALEKNLDYIEGSIVLTSYCTSIINPTDKNNIKICIYNTSDSKPDIIKILSLDKNDGTNFKKVCEFGMDGENLSTMRESAVYWTLKKYQNCNLQSC